MCGPVEPILDSSKQTIIMSRRDPKWTISLTPQVLHAAHQKRGKGRTTRVWLIPAQHFALISLFKWLHQDRERESPLQLHAAHSKSALVGAIRIFSSSPLYFTTVIHSTLCPLPFPSRSVNVSIYSDWVASRRGPPQTALKQSRGWRRRQLKKVSEPLVYIIYIA